MKRFTMKAVFLIVLLTFFAPCFSYKALLIEENYLYEVYEPEDDVPRSLLEESEEMYFDAYREPKMHEGIPLKVLQIDWMLAYFSSF